MSSTGNISLFNLGNILKYDYRRLNVGIGDNPSIYTRLNVVSSDTGFSSNLWISAIFGGTNKNVNKVAIGSVNSNAVISAIDINNNFTDLYINNNSVNNYGNVYFLGNIYSSNNLHLLNGNIGIGKYASYNVALDVNNKSINNDVAYFGNSNITFNKFIITYNNNIPTIGAKDSNYNWSPMIINGDNLNNGNTVTIPNSLFVNNNFYCSGNIGIGTTFNNNYRLIINGGNILINNNSSTSIGFSGNNNSLSVYGYGFFNSNIGIGTFPTSSYILSVASGNSIFNNNSFVSIGSSGNNNSLSVYGYGFFNSNIGIGTFPTSSYILSVASGNVLFNNNTNLYIGSSGSNNSLSLYGNSSLLGNVGIGTVYDSNKLKVSGNTLIDGNLTATNLIGNGSLITNLNPSALSSTSTFFNSISGNLINYDSVFFKVINNNTLSIIPGSVTASSSQWITLNSTTLYYNPSASTNQAYVGIGTSNPSGSFQVGTGYRLRVSAGSSSDYSIIGVYEGALNTSIILCGTAFNVYNMPGSVIYNAVSGSGYHLFQSDNKEIVRFTNLGQVGIGTIPRVFSASSNNDILAVNGNITISNGFGLNVGITNNTTNFLNVFGSIGIGTVANNSFALLTNGGNITFSNSSIVNVGTSGVSNSLTIWGYVGIGRTASSSYIMYVIGGGNILFDNNITVGIGTTNASGNTNILNVFGPTNIYGSIGIGTSSIGTNMMTIASGNIKFIDSSIISIGSTTVSTNNSLSLFGNQTIYGSSSLLTTVSIGSTNNTSSGNLLSVYGNTFFGNNYTVSVGSTTTNNTNIFKVFGNSSFYSTVGIGTTYTNNILTVAAGISNFLNGSAVNIGATSGNTLSVYGSVGIGTVAQPASTCILGINTGIINIYNGSTLNIGISSGSANPNILNCYGNTNLYGNVGINTIASSTVGNILTIGTGIITFNNPSTINIGNISATANTFNLYGSASINNNIYIGQNIGIGTAFSSSITNNNININSNSTTNFGANSIINLGIVGTNNSSLNIYGNNIVYGNTSLLSSVGIGTVFSTITNTILVINGGISNFLDTSTVNVGTVTANNNNLNVYGNFYSSLGIGIGTVADSSGVNKLLISGGSGSTVTLYNGNTLNIGISGNTSALNVYGSVGIGTSFSSTAILTIKSGTTNLLDTSILNVGTTGSTNSLNVYGNTTISDSLTIGNINTLTATVLNITGITNFINGSVVNIGTTGTSSTLNVLGSINIYQYSIFTNSVGIGTTYSTSAVLTVKNGTTNFNNTSIVNIGNSGTTNNLNVYGTTLSNFITATGNIGIGTVYSVNYTLNNYGSAYFSIPANIPGVGINAIPNTSYSLVVAGNTNFTGDMIFSSSLSIKTSTNTITAPVLAGNLNASYIQNFLNISQGGIGTAGAGFTNNSFIYFNNTTSGVNPAFYTYTNLVFTPGVSGLNDLLAYKNSTITVGTISLNSSTGLVSADSFTGSASGLSNIPVNKSTGVLPVVNGGTGNSSAFTNNNLIYANSVNSLSTCGFISINNSASTINISGALTSISFIGSGSNLTNLNATNINNGVLSVGNGGTGITTLTNGSILFATSTNTLSTNANLTWTFANSIYTLNIVGNIIQSGIKTMGPISLNSTTGVIIATSYTGSASGLTNIPLNNSTGVLSISNGGIGTASIVAQTGAILFSNSNPATFMNSSINFYYNDAAKTLYITSGSINVSNGVFNTISTITTPLAVSNGGTGSASYTTNGIVFMGSSSTFSNSSSLTWSGTTLNISGSISCTGSITSLTSPITVSCGGIGVSSINTNSILIGNGTGAVLSYSGFTFNNSSSTLNISSGTIVCNAISTVSINASGSITGNGSSITGLNATNITSGKLHPSYFDYDSSAFTIASGKLTISSSAASPWLTTAGLTIYNNSSPSATTVGIGTNAVATNNILQVNGGVLFVATGSTVFNITNGSTVNYLNITNNNGVIIPNFLTIGQGNANTNTNYALFVNGNIAATQNIGITSDVRLKKNIKTIENALDKIKACRGVYFNRIDSDNLSIGVIAQEIEKILPEVVLTPNDKNDFKSVLYQNIVAVLIEAVKDMDDKFNNLDNRIKLLEKNYN